MQESPASPSRIWSLGELMSSVSAAMAWVGGLSFLLLSFYVSYDVLARSYGGPYSGVTDDMSGYVLAVGGTLGMAYALRIGAHVRIDLLLPFVPLAVRYFLNLGNVTLLAFFAILLAWYSWASAYESFDMDARSISILPTPLAIPQGLMALSFTLLLVQAVLIVAEGLLRLHRLGSAAWHDHLPGDAEAAAEDVRGV